MAKVLIIGAKSDIAQAVARVYARAGFDLILAARKSEDLASLAQDIKVRYQKSVDLKDLDVAQYKSHQKFCDDLAAEDVAGVVFVAGFMPDQKAAEADWRLTENTIAVNYAGAVSLLELLAARFEEKKAGFIVGVSSVAGDRGRKTNYIYGSAKAGFTAYLSGLRNRLFAHGVHVLTMKPGFVYTQMTQELDLPPALTAQPEDVAEAIISAQEKGKDVLYVKWMWRYIMLIITHLPEFVFKRTSL